MQSKKNMQISLIPCTLMIISKIHIFLILHFALGILQVEIFRGFVIGLLNGTNSKDISQPSTQINLVFAHVKIQAVNDLHPLLKTTQHYFLL